MEMAFVNAADPFKHGFILFDANILSALASSKRAARFCKIYDLLGDKQCEMMVLNSTKFELVGYCNDKAIYDKLNAWVDRFAVLDIKKEDIELAAFLSAMYKYRSHEISPKQISFCDCLNAAQLIKYQGRLPLITADIHDYPLFIFDIAKTMIIDDNGKAVFVGIITYNEKKWLDLKSKFERSPKE
ncbi:MAG: hypothetical protein L7H18_04055 [Candidatus Nealsonbacteria bacterium DGGOD1a]|jgi:predicted nucleic acid-binding protein|nr:MAG: hypothetical protein L7H18_04055 [Candidatus Nealsonbacteria bacterium DGGOD1a]